MQALQKLKSPLWAIVVWFWTQDKEFLMILHVKEDLASRFSQHPSLPTWHIILPPILNFSAQ